MKSCGWSVGPGGAHFCSAALRIFSRLRLSWISWPGSGGAQEGTPSSVRSSKTTMFLIRRWSSVRDLDALFQRFQLSLAPGVWLFV